MSTPSPLLSTVLLALVSQAFLYDPPPRVSTEAPRTAELRTRLEHAGDPLEGTRRAKLVITRGSTVLWSHDGTGSHERQPDSAFEVELRAGELHLELGRPPMRPLPDGLLADPAGAALHLWIEVDGHFLRAPSPFPLDPQREAREASEDALVRSERVIDSKVERKRRRLQAGQNKRPESPNERLRFRRQQRLDDRGEIAPDALLRAKRHLDSMPVLNPGAGLTKDAGLWSWTWLGPGNIGGRVRAVLAHPSQPDTLWIGSAGGGIWKTLDGGASWSPSDDFMASLAVTSLAAKPSSPNVLYAATGEGFGNGDALPGAGIFKSLDGGASWTHLPATNPATEPAWQWVNRLATNPSQPSWLFAITADGRVWRSVDEGLTFTQVLNTFQAGLDLKVHQGQVYFMAAGTNRGVWTSSNYGSPGSWTFHSTGFAGKLPAEPGRAEIALNTGTPITIYASLDRNKGEVWRSQDAGATWTLRSTGKNLLGPQGWYYNTIWVDPTDATRLVVGGVDLWTSSDSGASWLQITDWTLYHLGWSLHGDQHAVVPHAGFDGAGNKTIFVGNDGGIQRVDDFTKFAQFPFGNFANLANGLGITQFYRGAVAPDGSVLIGGTQDNDTLRYKPASGAGGWYQAKTGDGGACAVNWLLPNVLYAEYVNLDIEQSVDGGSSYSAYTNFLSDAGECCNALFIAPFEMDPNDPNTLVAGGTSIWTVGFLGLWSAIRGPITHGTWSVNKCDGGCSNNSNPACSAIAIAKGDSSTIWVGYESGRVSRTLDGGASWTDVDAALPSRYVTDIAIHPYDSNQVFVTLGGNQQQSIWYTSDGGATWADRTGVAPHDLPPIQLNTVTINPAQPAWVYVGTDLGVLASEDLGVTWSKLPLVPGVGTEGPVNTEVADLFWQGGSSLIAATHGRGMYRATPFAAIYVDKHYSGTQKGSFEQPFTNVAAAQAASFPGSTIVIKGETYLEAPLVFDQSGALHAVGGVVILR